MNEWTSIAFMVLIDAVLIVICMRAYLPARQAARGASAEEMHPRRGIRTQATMASADAWQRSHEAAMIYYTAMPWLTGISVVGGLVLAVLYGPLFGMLCSLIGLVAVVFVALMGYLFALVAARPQRRR